LIPFYTLCVAESSTTSLKRQPKKKEMPDMIVGEFSMASMKKDAAKRTAAAKKGKSRKYTTASSSGFHSCPKSTKKAKETLHKKKYGYRGQSCYVEYSDEDIKEAIEMVHAGMPVQDAALKYGIPRATLFNRSRDGCKTHTGRCSEVYLMTHGVSSTPFGKKRVHMQYSQEAMEKAIEAVHQGMPVIDAAILHKIPRASLFIRSAKGCPSHAGRCSTVFSNGKIRRTRASRHKYRQLLEMTESPTSTDFEHSLETSGEEKGTVRASPRHVNVKGNTLPKAIKIKLSDSEQALRVVTDLATGKQLCIPVEISKAKPVKEEPGSPQSTDKHEGEPEFETLTTTDSKVVLQRLKLGGKSTDDD
jgi:hypothetical protein